MARMKPKARTEFVLFDIIYDDGSQSSNRKVPGDLVGGLEGDAPAISYLETLEREIAERSGKGRPTIKSIERSKRK
jgi:hypothetical protein